MGNDEGTRCGACGARVATGAACCGRCHARVSGDVEPSYAHADAYAGPPLPREASRWRKSDVSFGPFGRIVATVLLCMVPMWWAAGYSLVMLIMWVFFFSPLLLRSIWKKTPIRS